MITLAMVVLGCAALAGVLVAWNLAIFAPPPARAQGAEPGPVSVLIPARNEEATIAEALTRALASTGIGFEIVVLDDGSSDGTADIVQDFARRDARVRLERAPPLPMGWNGKQHACHHLAGCARHPHLLFVDADVRLAGDALARLVPLLARADLISGIPRQETGTWSEKLLIPLIHIVLLGYLPMAWMRRYRSPAFGAGCGQLFLTTAEAYRRAGGHAAIRATMHDGLALPRRYRQAGLRTDLSDITALATCRMYRSDADTWRGLAKNAHEGMGAWGPLLPMTGLLGLGQVAPFALLVVGMNHPLPPPVLPMAALAAACAWAGRAAVAWRFRQSWMSVALHPIGVLGVLAIQWWARIRASAGIGSAWKGRVYQAG